MPIDPTSSSWPYQQVAAMIRERIAAGEWSPKLPTRQEIANELEVSHMTVQRAIDLLKDEGVLYSERGLGVFVREPGDTAH